MTNLGIYIKNKKRRGEWAELRFMACATAHGLSISKPWGDSERYDICIEYKGHFVRVQVKSTLYKIGPSYRCNLRTWNRRCPYTRDQLDFFAVYVIPKDLWYIVPARAVIGVVARDICLSPHLKGHKYECYMEAWDLLRRKRAKAKTKLARGRH